MMSASKETTPIFSLFPSSSSSTFNFSNNSTTQQLVSHTESTSRSIIKLKESVWGDLAKIIEGSGKRKTLKPVEERVPSPAAEKRRRIGESEAGRKGKAVDRHGVGYDSSREAEQMEQDDNRRLRREVSRNSASKSTTGSKDRGRTNVTTEEAVSRSQWRPSKRLDHLSLSPPPRNRSDPPPKGLNNPPFRTRFEALRPPPNGLQSTLRPSDYDRFLLPSPIEPLHSAAFYRLQIEFFCSAFDCYSWSSRPTSATFFPPVFSELVRSQIDFDLIQETCPLGPRGLDHSRDLTPIELAILSVLDWFYEERVGLDQLDFFLTRAPLPLLVLARAHGDVVRYGNAVHHAFLEFRAHVETKPRHELSRAQQRVKKLFLWLLTREGEKGLRWERWWCEEVVRHREGERSLTERWIECDTGWEGYEALERWEDARRYRGR